MPKNQDIKKVLVIGSGPIVIGQAAEFDYAGTQACRSLKEEGIEVVLVNSNPATIMTDKEIADEVYIEPLTAKSLRADHFKRKTGQRTSDLRRTGWTELGNGACRIRIFRRTWCETDRNNCGNDFQSRGPSGIQGHNGKKSVSLVRHL